MASNASCAISETVFARDYSVNLGGTGAATMGWEVAVMSNLAEVGPSGFH